MGGAGDGAHFDGTDSQGDAGFKKKRQKGTTKPKKSPTGNVAPVKMAMGAAQQFAIFSFLYFLEGMPYGIQADTLPLLFRATQNYSLSLVTFSKISLVPWLLKPFLAKKLNTESENVKVVKVALLLAAVVAFVAAVWNENDYIRLI